MIEACAFGSLKISGQTYTSDLMILPDDRIIPGWRREQGHRLSLDDIEPLMAADPDIIVVGTGIYGLMRPHAEMEPMMAQRGIQWVTQKTKAAVKSFNAYKAARKNVAACFHLTC